MMDSLIRAGWLMALTLSNRNMALQNLIVHEVLIKRKEAMDQFCKGLKILGVHSAVQVCPELMQTYFVAHPNQLTALQIMDLFANIDVLQENEKSERARGFLVKCIYLLEQGIIKRVTVSYLCILIDFSILFQTSTHFNNAKS